MGKSSNESIRNHPHYLKWFILLKTRVISHRISFRLILYETSLIVRFTYIIGYQNGSFA